MGDLLLLDNRLGHALQLADNSFDGLVDAPLDVDGVGACCYIFHAVLVDGISEHGCRRGAVASHVGGLGSNFPQELGAHVLIGVLELDLFCYGDAILSDGRGAEFFVNDDIPTPGTECGLHGITQSGDALQDLLSCGIAE